MRHVFRRAYVPQHARRHSTVLGLPARTMRAQAGAGAAISQSHKPWRGRVKKMGRGAPTPLHCLDLGALHEIR